MTVERLKEIAGRLREMGQFAKDDYVYTTVTVSEPDYYVDLGVFGERSLSVEIERDEYELDAERILDKYPITTDEFEALADELDSFEGDLDNALWVMKANGEGALVSVIRSLLASYRTYGNTLDLSGLSIGPLPEKPLPWPGAQRFGIDYTAADFPLRYQPPPGFDWVRDNYGNAVGYRNAVAVSADIARQNNQMVMDNTGRVKWDQLGDDDYTQGSRWRVWHLERDGIPRSRGMNGSTEPRGISRDGTPLAPTTIDEIWNAEQYVQARTRLREIQAEYAQVAFAVNGYGVTYDPLTVEVADAGRSDTDELRLGDLITGGYGRLVAAQQLPDGQYEVVVRDRDVIRRDVRGAFNWLIKPVSGVPREQQPTALAATQPDVMKHGYDPLTIEVGDLINDVPVNELRVGDNVTPGNWGRVLAVEPSGPGFADVTFQLEGKKKTERLSLTSTWSLQPVTGVNRALLPTALSFAASSPVDYDSLTIAIDTGNEMLVKTSELRLGDDVIGERWGRVVKVNPDFTFEMNRDGKINTWDNTSDSSWSIYPIDVADRDAVPPAITLTRDPAEVAF